MPEPDRKAALYVYQQIAADIAARIARNELKPGQPIPSETQLGQAWPGVARTTIRRAVKALRQQGLVHTVPGRGTYVGPAPD